MPILYCICYITYNVYYIFYILYSFVYFICCKYLVSYKNVYTHTHVFDPNPRTKCFQIHINFNLLRN